MLIKYKDIIKELSSAGSGIASLDKLNIKVTNSKKSAFLHDLGTLNAIDSLKAEFTTFDPQVI